MDVLDSVRRAVRHYPGGLDAVALRLGKARLIDNKRIIIEN